MKKKLDTLIWTIFSGIGVVFLIIGIILCVNIFNYKNKKDTIGTITRISASQNHSRERDADVYVQYQVDGQTYESRLNYYSSSFYEGKEIEIYYDVDNPHKIGTKSGNLLFLMFPGFGLIFSGIGMSGLIVRRKKKRLEKRLRAEGRRILADYRGTVVNTSYTINGAHPYNVLCEWDNFEDNKKYLFKSKNIWFNPENIILERNITTLPVYLDPQNIKKYYVDVDFLTENVVDLR